MDAYVARETAADAAAEEILSELMSGKYQAMDGSNKKIKDLERDLIGRKIPGFFPTPAPIVNEMIQRADIKPGMKVLEPSAGKGDIADAIRAAGVDPDVVEPYSSLRDILKEKGHSIVGDDFLEFGQEKRDGTYGDTFAAPDGTVGYLRGSGGMGSDRVKLVDENGQQLGLYSKSDLTLKQKNGEYDRIVMNPPFEKGADIDHVRLAYDLLKPGGKLVAVMGEGPFFRSDNKAKEFRDWLATVGTSETLPENSFKGKDSFRQTGVNTRLVEIEKPGRSLSEAMKGNQNAAGERTTEQPQQSSLPTTEKKPTPQVAALPGMQPLGLKDSKRAKSVKDAVRDAKKESRLSIDAINDILDEAQAGKQFKDVGARVAGSRKETMAMSYITMDDLEKLDPATAEKMVRKDKVLTPFEPLSLKSQGESPGLVFIKKKILDSIAQKPSDSPNSRILFVHFAKKLSDDITAAKSYEDIEKIAEKYFVRMYTRGRSGFKHEYLFSDSVMADPTVSEALKQADAASGGKDIMNMTLRGGNRQAYSASAALGGRFLNMMDRSTDAAKAVWTAAKTLDPLTDAEARASYDAYATRMRESANKTKARFDAMTPEERLKEIKAHYQYNKISWTQAKAWYSQPGSTDEDLVRETIQRFISKSEPVEYSKWIEKSPLRAARPADWSWLEPSQKTRQTTKEKDITIHESPELSHIRRKNGRKVPPRSNAEILRQDFGLDSAQFGASLDDRFAGTSVRRFAESMYDLEDATGLDIKKLIQTGGLNMAFASRGVKGAAAHYEPGHRIINLTRSNGDGSLAHEFGHFIDHYLGGMKPSQRGNGEMATHGGNPENPRIKSAVESVMNAMREGQSTKEIRLDQEEIDNMLKGNDGRYDRETVTVDNALNSGGVEKAIAEIKRQAKIYAGARIPFSEAAAFRYLAAKNGGRVEIPVDRSAFMVGAESFQSDYWRKPTEMFARAFEAYTYDKLKSKDMYNNYLVSGNVLGVDDKYAHFPGAIARMYPQGEERKTINAAFDRLIDVLKEEKGLQSTGTSGQRVSYDEPVEPKKKSMLLSDIPFFRLILKSEKLVGGEGDCRPDSEFNPEDLEAAVQHEMREHGHDRQIATELAKDHLTEDPDYYRKLVLIEKGHGRVQYECGHMQTCRCREGHKLPIRKAQGFCSACKQKFGIRPGGPQLRGDRGAQRFLARMMRGQVK
jgi:hypothetical protein